MHLLKKFQFWPDFVLTISATMAVITYIEVIPSKITAISDLIKNTVYKA